MKSQRERELNDHQREKTQKYSWDRYDYSVIKNHIISNIELGDLGISSKINGVSFNLINKIRAMIHGQFITKSSPIVLSYSSIFIDLHQK